jgi:hypothetical protein
MMEPVVFFKLLVDLVLGVLSVPFITFIKQQLGWSQGKALLLAVGVAGVLGAAELGIAGYFEVEAFTLDQLFYTISAVVAASQIYFSKLKINKENGAVG